MQVIDIHVIDCRVIDVHVKVVHIIYVRVTYVHVIYLKPKVTLHFEEPNISLLFLILTKSNIAMSCRCPP